MNGRDIVMMSLQNWGESLGSNSYNLAIEFSQQNRVLYINRAPDRISQLRNVLNRKIAIKDEEWISNPRKNIHVLHTKSILESINRLPKIIFEEVNYFNGKKLANEIQKAIEHLQIKDFVLFIDNDFFRGLHLKEFLKPDLFIYYIRDNLRTHEYFKKHGELCEVKIAKKADLILANSPFLTELLRPNNPNAHDIGQGCDFKLFRTEASTKPYDFPKNNNPNIGYIGNIVSYRLDLSLLERICEKRKEWNWIFVGPEDKQFENSKLHKISNVYFLGIKKENELATYIGHMDICINPQQKNGMTEGNYPRKIDEYLFMGKPVIATRTNFMSSFSEYVSLYDDAEGFESCIEAILAKTDNNEIKKMRKSFAEKHSWENCIKKIYALSKFQHNG
jgi:glycosyltransferase involved in cell wall biosynthesis